MRVQLAKREPMDLRDVDIPHGTIVLEKWMNINLGLLLITAILFFFGFIDFEKAALSIMSIACFFLYDIHKELRKWPRNKLKQMHRKGRRIMQKSGRTSHT